MSAFRSLSYNGQIDSKFVDPNDDPNYLNDLDVYITYESIRKNYHKNFNIPFNETFSLRLYNLLAKGKFLKRVYLPQFMLQVHPLIFGDWI